ncbi:extracellular solute-binding protein [Paenibacillus nanensis]|uniref:Extracellular solute-binding protein n=1 Tax=Paenibacillus nanensis TaxID=393251 RepID=A0A3A1UW37_9BACL|nr:extracellular solute-binding protein [Paenibacillus nanensis]RIX51402.1 extracellular solute-binding protein [Paenibacillus nanensis]
MRHWKKISLVLALAVSVFAAGCSNNSNSNTGTDANSSTNAPSNASNDQASDETITIATNASTWEIPTNDDNPTQKYLEERYNVKFVNMRGTDENYKTMIASGEIPDIFPHNITEADMTNWARQGVIAEIDMEEIKKYMPSYTAHVEEVDPNAWNIGIIDGKNYGVPRIWLNGAYGFIPTYNGEWLEAIGYKEPPKTIEELEDVLTKFRNNDPDKNGQKDTYGISGRGKDVRVQLFNSIYAAYGVNPYHFKLAADGSVTWGGITDESKEALKLLNQWYKSELIDPEFMTDDGALLDQKWSSKKIGYIDHKMYHHLFGAVAGNTENGITAVYGKGLIGPAGKSIVMSNGPLQVPLMFGKQVQEDEAKRIRILQMLEDLATKDEVYLRTVFGVEGESYDLVDGVPVMKEEFTATADPAREMGIGGFYNPLIERDTGTWKFHFTPDKLEFRDKVNAGLETTSDILGPTAMETKGKYMATLTTLQDEFYIKAIIGDEDIDKAFEGFKNQWLKTGGQELLDEATKIYQERQSAK